MLQATLSRIFAVVSCFAMANIAMAETAAVENSYDIEALVKEADINRGRMLFIQCQACHTLKEGEGNRVGPNLHGVISRNAGQAKDFAYSDALKAKSAELVWDNATLDAFITRPSEYIPGTKMVFVGVKKPEDRAAIIKWVNQETTK